MSCVSVLPPLSATVAVLTETCLHASHTGIEALQIGSHNVFEPRSRVSNSITIGSQCIIGAGCSILPLSVPTSIEWSSLDGSLAQEQAVEEEEAKEYLEDYTVVYGRENQRRQWSGEGKGQQEALMIKHLAYLTEILPKYSRLKLIP